MENSAKALLIAGSILLFVLLSTFMMYVFAKTRNHTSDIYDLMFSADTDSFNQKFLKYEDKTLKIQDVVSIINQAKDYNRKGKFPVLLKVTAESGIIDGTSETNLLSDNIKIDDINNILKNNIEKEYKCTICYAENSNLVETIKIENNS